MANWVAGGRPIGFASRHEVLAALPDGGIAHWSVAFDLPGEPGRRLEMDGILVVRLGPDGRCMEHREWYATREVPAGPLSDDRALEPDAG